MKQFLALLILATFGLHSCNTGTSETWKDEDIDASIKSEIERLDKLVLEAVTTNNPSLIRNIMSDALLEKAGNDVNLLIEQVQGIISNDDYTVLNQFQVKNSTTGTSYTLMSGISGANDYILHNLAFNKDMFISLIISKNGLNEFIVTNIYGKYPDGWKLNILQIGQYKINGQTAPELSSRAKEDFDKGFLIDAANNIKLCSRVSTPSNKIWQYQKEEEMRQLQEQIKTAVTTQFSFPLTLENIESKPQIFNIYAQGMKEGYFPMVEYLTSIDLKDSVKTKQENDQLHSLIGLTFKGLDQNKKYVFYKVFGEMPNGITPVPTYGFVKEINEKQ